MCIHEKRTEMIKIAQTDGLNGELTIQASQELDHLLNAYHNYLVLQSKHRGRKVGTIA
ncbi:aspartyl-phosphate phosphatase Spo0E family protein [Bacillaceae bacterium SIJ1]|nr:aspartyl-phosphate phosphatase Spo0E family protein [Litoribacterium kuwaitense]